MIRILVFLVLAAILGVIGSTTSACVVGLAQGTNTWCGIAFIWPVGFLVAIPHAILFGVPADFLYRNAGWCRWWQFVAGGALLALPIWYQLPESFESLH